MPHMMPMLWMLIFMYSFLFLFALSSMIYFFYIPSSHVFNKYHKSIIKLYKWNWMW